MKHARVFGFTVLLALAMLVSLFNSPAFASAETKASAVPSVSASGRGWFVFNGFRHNFGFAVHEGKLNEASGWRYAPKSFVFLSVFNFEGTKIFELRSVFVWRFRTEEADGDAKVLIVGVANVTTSKGVLEKWWFRMEDRDIDNAEKGVDSFAVFLWRPGGADKPGCWTARLFDPYDPASVHLNPAPFYRAFGRLRGGFVEIAA